MLLRCTLTLQTPWIRDKHGSTPFFQARWKAAEGLKEAAPGAGVACHNTRWIKEHGKRKAGRWMRSRCLHVTRWLRQICFTPYLKTSNLFCRSCKIHFSFLKRILNVWLFEHLWVQGDISRLHTKCLSDLRKATGSAGTIWILHKHHSHKRKWQGKMYPGVNAIANKDYYYILGDGNDSLPPIKSLHLFVKMFAAKWYLQFIIKLL